MVAKRIRFQTDIFLIVLKRFYPSQSIWSPHDPQKKLSL